MLGSKHLLLEIYRSCWEEINCGVSGWNLCMGALRPFPRVSLYSTYFNARIYPGTWTQEFQVITCLKFDKYKYGTQFSSSYEALKWTFTEIHLNMLEVDGLRYEVWDKTNGNFEAGRKVWYQLRLFLTIAWAFLSRFMALFGFFHCICARNFFLHLWHH